MLPLPIDFLRHSLHFACFKEGPLIFAPFPEGFYNSLKEETTTLHQKYCTMLFLKAVSVLDDAVLDVESINFCGSVLAAGVFWKVYPMEDKSFEEKELLLKISTG